jgi:hypothetical protein
LALTVGVTGPARADNIDQELFKQATPLIEYLRKQGYQNVGVLKFRVQQGARGESFDVGPLNINMATRLENLLVVKNAAKPPVGIIHDASRVASQRKLQEAYVTDNGRRQLFEYNYPLAWGKEEVKADAFLTGLVNISRDNRQARVTIEAFDQKSTELKKVQDFSVRTDRTILADAGKAFLLRDATKGDREDNAADAATAQDKNVKTPLCHSEDRYVDLQIIYNDRRIPVTVGADGQARVPSPEVGDAVKFRITNVSKLKVGVLLGVNGVNTLFEELLAERRPSQCTKWILGPGDSYDINGFYLDRAAGEKNVKLFKVTENSWRLELYGDRLGMIHLGVFCEGGARDDLKITGPNLRGLSRVQRQKNLPQSLPELQYRLVRQMLKENPSEKLTEELQALRQRALLEWKASPLGQRGGAIIPQDEPAGTSTLTKVEFKNPQLVMEENIRYFDPKRGK